MTQEVQPAAEVRMAEMLVAWMVARAAAVALAVTTAKFHLFGK